MQGRLKISVHLNFPLIFKKKTFTGSYEERLFKELGHIRY